MVHINELLEKQREEKAPGVSMATDDEIKVMVTLLHWEPGI